MRDALRHAEFPENPDHFDPFASGDLAAVVATTEGQRELWLGDRLGEDATLAYNEANALHLKGPLDTGALARAVERVVARHESLRASFSPDGTQLFVAAPGPFALRYVDLSGFDATARDKRLALAFDAAVNERFVLEKGPLFRATLVVSGPEDHTLILSAHHAVCDGWSWGVIVSELGQLYARERGLGQPRPLAPAPRYADYAQWEAEEMAGPGMQAHADYWLARFASPAPPLELPLDRPRPPLRSFRSKRADGLLDAELIERLRQRAAGSNSSLYAGLFAAFAGLLHRLTEQEDIVIGIAAAGQLAADMPRLVGHCVNLLPLRVALNAETPMQALIEQSRGLLLDAFEHQSLGYGTLLRKMLAPRDPGRLPLMSVLFNVDGDTEQGADSFPGLQASVRSLPRTCENFELFLNMTPVAGGGMRWEMQYNVGLFDEESIRRWMGLYECLLKAAVHEPGAALGQIDLLTEAEEARLRALQPRPTPLARSGLAHAGFEAMAAAQPDRMALRHGAQHWTYRELDQRANRLAHALRARGMGRGQRVGLCLPRDADMLVAVLAVLKCGAAYVPLDPDFPKARLDDQAADARLGLLITATGVAHAPVHWCSDHDRQVLRLDRDEAWHLQPAEPLPAGGRDAQPGDMAFLIYTSGSTGRPKGVGIPHGAVANLLQSMRHALRIGPGDRVAAASTLGFDIAVMELILPLEAGAEIVLVPRETARDGQAYRRLIESEQITVLQATPSAWRLLLDAQWPGHPRLKAISGGETLPRELALALASRCGEVWNMYGPTETTVYSTLWRVDAAALTRRGVAIGRPIANTSVWILDRHGRRCPVGVPGEICIGGAGVALGYFERPELTERAFVPDPFGAPGERLYRSGDRGRWCNDGLLEHQGRLDLQVKVRGHRIEPEEVEAHCNQVPGVAASVVVAREDQPGDMRLVAYLVASPGARIDTSAVQQALASRLPPYMQPQHLVVLDELPRLPNGKIHRKALPAPGAARTAQPIPLLAARDPRERAVLQAMEQVLSLPGIGVRDDFFALGGHSLLASRLAIALGRMFGVTVPLRTLFAAPTAERLAVALAELQAGETADAPAPLPRRTGRSSAPLTPMQERILFLEEMHPGRPVYNTPSAHRLSGPIDAGAFQEALREVVRRQPALRTAFDKDAASGAFVASIAAEVPVTLAQVDLRDLPADQREPELIDRLQELADAPVDIHRAPLFNATLIRMDEEDHVFVFVPHRLIWDGASLDLLLKELSTIYQARIDGVAHTLPELPATHGDHAEWYQAWMQSPPCEEQARFWKQRFADTPPPKALRTDMPRRAGMTGQGGTQWLTIDRALTEQLHAVARGQALTLNMLTLGIYVLMLDSLGDARALVVATPVRGRAFPELDGVMGSFSNLLPLPLEIDRGQTLPAFLQYVKEQLVSAIDRAQFPFERLAGELAFSGSTKGIGLYQASFSFQDARERPLAIGPLRHRELRVSQRGATEDLGLWLTERHDGLEGALTYNADIYRRETAAALRGRYVELLQRVAANPRDTLEALVGPAADGDSPDAAYLRRWARSEAAAAAAPEQADARAGRPAAATAHAALTPAQHRLAQIWADVLRIQPGDIRASDNFFDLGGDSLQAMRAIQVAERHLGFRTEPPRYVFENLGQLASREAALAIGMAAGDSAKGRSAAAPSAGLLGRMFSGLGRQQRPR
ncbi:hypothetical protein GCM10023165_16800 [Variovorax defluvii]|uniref:Carrier domain-containing protein n=1 Tax=Variovorax defluvii TaxID=913761 RepID=A0ABP8HEZ5_9BURK